MDVSAPGCNPRRMRAPEPFVLDEIYGARALGALIAGNLVTAHPPVSGFEVFVTVGERSGMWLSGMVCGWGSLMVTGG